MKNLLLKLLLPLLAAAAPVAATAATQTDMFAKPGVIGDSLSHGFYGATVEKKTQDWAYPVLVTKQAGSSLSYNVLEGPYLNFEDVLKLNCGPICIASSVLGGNASTVALPTHAGITGAEYSTVLRTSGQCEDITARKQERQWYWKTWYWYTYRWVEVADCQTPDKFHQFGLRGSGTQMQIMEKVKPSFLFGSVGANHVLCTALHTSLDCLDADRFKRDFSETMRRLAAMGSLQGGVIFTVPNVTSIAYLEKYTDPQNRPEYSGLKPFYRSSVSSADQVLDANEVATIGNFLQTMNNDIKSQGAAMGFAVADLKVVFDDIRENGRPITGPNGTAPGLARANWPLPNQPGLFGLDGVHPNMLGHAVFSNELIKSINAKYGYTIPAISEYSAWANDSLNRNPVDLKNFLDNNLFGQFMSWVIGVFA